MVKRKQMRGYREGMDFVLDKVRVHSDLCYQPQFMLSFKVMWFIGLMKAFN